MSFSRRGLVALLVLLLALAAAGARWRFGRALANRPPLILADELTAALDTERGGKVMALLRRIARERGSAVITVTHDHRMIEGFDTVHRLEDGRLVETMHHAVV